MNCRLLLKREVHALELRSNQVRGRLQHGGFFFKNTLKDSLAFVPGLSPQHENGLDGDEGICSGQDVVEHDAEPTVNMLIEP